MPSKALGMPGFEAGESLNDCAGSGACHGMQYHEELRVVRMNQLELLRYDCLSGQGAAMNHTSKGSLVDRKTVPNDWQNFHREFS